jgi:hypothetical protein
MEPWEEALLPTAPRDYIQVSPVAIICHRPGARCHVSGPHPMRECTALKYEEGPFPDCRCEGHYSRVDPNGYIAGAPNGGLSPLP